MNNPAHIGIVGCGNISQAYVKRLLSDASVRVYACADLDLARARALAEQYAIPRACSLDDLLKDDQVEVVLNLTNPPAHAPVSLQAIAAGKHVYTEKPFATSRADGLAILEAAEKKGVMVGGAPDTFLQPNIQACRAAIDAGRIGSVVAGNAFFLSHGHESWHPNPDFYYQAGGGPLFDMGPYYLAALVTLLGPVKQVSGMAKTSFDQRTLTAPTARRGQKIPVSVRTHFATTLQFADQTIISLTTSFDVWPSDLPDFELYGVEGVLQLPRTGTYVSSVAARLKRPSDENWTTVIQAHEIDVKFGIGLLDMVAALRQGAQPRASGRFAFHVLDIMLSLAEAVETGQRVSVHSTCERPQSDPSAQPAQ